MARGMIRYTPEQLEHIRSSPLVLKPDGLPSIEQWMENPAEQNGRRPRSQVTKEGEQPANGEIRTERPALVNVGMGHFARRSSTQPEDTVLGPPKLSFTSASRNAKTIENSEKRPITSQDAEGSATDRFSVRERWTKERDAERGRDKAVYTNGRRGTREDGEGWTSVKSRKSLGQDDLDRGTRNGDRDRDRYQKDGDVDTGDTASRRIGMGRGRIDLPWSRDDGTAKEEGNKSGARSQGWRDREKDRDRDRDRDRDWTRGGRIEEDPEWMDTPVVSEKKQAHTQEDFQRWKERMKAGKTSAEEKEPILEQPPSNIEPTTAGAVVTNAATSKPATPLALDGGLDKLFGMWGEGSKRTDANNAEVSAVSKAAKPKPKSSRFAGLFAPPEETKQSLAPAPTPASPEPPASGNSEDKEGFQRILQMLGGASTSAAPISPQDMALMNGMRQGGVRLDFQQPHPDERSDNIPPARQQIPRSREDRNTPVDAILAPRPSAPESRPSQSMFSPLPPDMESGQELYRGSRPESSRPVEDFPMQPPSRNGSAQDALNLQALLGGRAPPEPSRDSKRDFLLTLMQQPRATPPQMGNQNIPRQSADNPNYSLFMENNAPKAQAPPKTRGLPPGIFDDSRIFSENEMYRREASIREANMREATIREANIREANMREASLREASMREMREASIREANMREASMRDAVMPQPEALRKPSQRLPPGIFDDSSIASLQRRNTTENMPRQMTNMGIPQQPVSDLPPWMKNPGMAQAPQERNIAPPPGFGPGGMRQPPGFGGPQGGPQTQMGPFSAGNAPLGHPGMPPPRGLGGPGGMFPGGQGQMPPPGHPQGYFPPPGFQPGMQRGEDPRMMMGGPPRGRMEYEQYDAQGRLTGTRPPNMFGF
ncbi:hypothetical protein K432DRAFT_391298 [Lepidopterella palustris CBS 459.81]|uniref:Uncharacterized protein n=1 Tax=Lepidopterella palustris CBS 459.81 TaxID=1314670 RepID=A0A8E2EE80_9PEZI|nr:hypothetical protein K432DRAFT_391298 [Lepidopterella palustris CBS 459.81]